MAKQEPLQRTGSPQRISQTLSSASSLTAAWDGASFDSRSAMPSIGEVLSDRYELRAILGSGSYGQVFAAWDHVRSRMIAVKVLRDARPDALLQFKQEFRALNELRHRNLVRLLKLGRNHDIWFIVMELIEGAPITVANLPDIYCTEQRRQAMLTTLAAPPEAIGSEDPRVAGELSTSLVIGGQIAPLFPVDVLRDRLGQLCQGIVTLHRFGVIHCDLKPSNVMVTHDNRVVILDFGVAKYTNHLGAHQQSDGSYAGTRPYMAPEIRQLARATPGVDWYALGVMLAELLTGHAPTSIAATPYPALSALLQQAGELHQDYAQMYDLCAKLLHPDPTQRADHQAVLDVCFGEDSAQLDAPSQGRSYVFVGREYELEQLQRSLNIFLDGAPSTLIVEGEAGIGKSTLCGEFLRRIALEPGAPCILLARCKNDELLGFRAFDELVDGLAAIMRSMPHAELEELVPYCTPALASLFPTLRAFNRDAHADAPVGSPEDALYALQALLSNISQRRRLIIWVEDVHQADRDSLRWIARIFAPGTRPNVFLLLSMRPIHPPTGETVDIDTLGYAVPMLRLRPLDAETSREALLSWLPDSMHPNAELLQTLLTIGRGHPYMLRELSHYADRVVELKRGVTLATLLSERIAALPPDYFTVLSAVATSFEAPNRQLVEFVTQLEPTIVDQALEELERLALVRQAATVEDEHYELAHAAINDCVENLANAETRKQIHARYAEAGIEGFSRPMRPAAIVAHLVRAEKQSAAESYALQLASASDRSGAYETAAQMYDLLMQIGREQGRRIDSELRMRAVECQLRTGRLLDAANLLVELAMEASPAEARVLRRRSAESYILSGHIEEGYRQNELARPPQLTSYELPLPRPIRVGLLRARIKKRLKDFKPEHTSLTELDELTAALMSTYRMSGIDIGMIDALSGFEFSMRELDLALDLNRRAPIVRALAGFSAFASMPGGEHQKEARRWVELAIRMGETADDPATLEWAKVCEAAIDYHQGYYRRAWKKIVDSYAWVETHASHQSVMLSYLEMHRLFCTNLFGEIDVLRAAYYGQIVEARARNNRMTEASVTLTGFVTWLIDDAPEPARAALHRAQLTGPRKGYQLYDFLRRRSLAELCLYEKRADAYDEQIQQYRRFEATMLCRTVELCRHEGRMVHSRLLLARAKHRGHLPVHEALLLQTWGRILCKSAVPLSQGWGHQMMAGAYAMRGDRQRAAEHLQSMAEIFEVAGIMLFAEVARAAGQLAGFFPRTEDPFSVLRTMGVINPERFVRSTCPYV